ncbi:MAG: LysM domain-containing protein [Verrucomicrobiota bacterium]
MSAPIPKNEWFIHRVVPGETLAFLLKLYGIEQDRLFQLNGIEDAETFRPGLLLKIP